MTKTKSRVARWGEAASRAVDGLSELVELQQEYQSWLDNLPENLQSSSLNSKLEEICNLELEAALETAQEADSIDLPLGFGRD